MTAYFVSDLHLSDSAGATTHKFVQWLNSIPPENGDTWVFLVGDVFDLWIADHEYFRQKFTEVVEAVANACQRGVRVIYFEGNHDLYLKHFWQDQLGVEVYGEPHYFQLGTWQVRVEHGDQIDPDDRGYRFLRWFLRTPIMCSLAKNLPSSWVACIGERASMASRKYTSHTKTIASTQAIAKIRQHAQKIVQERTFDFLISGHLHVQDDYQFYFDGKQIRSINLGSWFEKPQVLKLTEQQVEFLPL